MMSIKHAQSEAQVASARVVLGSACCEGSSSKSQPSVHRLLRLTAGASLALLAASTYAQSLPLALPFPSTSSAKVRSATASTQAVATFSYQTGRIQNIFSRSYADGQGLVYVVLDGQRVSAPPCATGPYWMIADEKSEAGKREIAILMAARLNDTQVTIVGRQTCTKWVDGEDIHEIIL